MAGSSCVVLLCALCALLVADGVALTAKDEYLSTSSLPGYKSASHVLVLGLSGLGSAYFNDTSRHPTLDSLIANGASSFTARDSLPTQSKPNWAAVLAGAGPEETGVDSDAWYHLENCDNYGVKDQPCLLCMACSTVIPAAQFILERNPGLYNETEAAIETLLHDVCDSLKFPLKTTCNTFVNLFGDQIITQLLLNQTAAQICQEVKVCRVQLDALSGPRNLFPTMFKAAKYQSAQLQTVCLTDDAVVAGLLERRLVDVFTYFEANSGGLVTKLGQLMSQSQPEVVFMHIGNIQRAGAAYGYGSQRYLDAIGVVDQELATILAYYQDAGVLDDTLILITSDHGGLPDGSSGSGDTADVEIPWIVSGPGVKSGYNLMSYVRGMDIPATALHALGVDRPALWQGHPILEAWTGAPQPPVTPPAPAVTSSVIVLDISGLLPSAVASSMPNVNALKVNGASTSQARAVMPSTTLPNVASILMGAGPEETGVCAAAIDQPCQWQPPPASASLPPTTGAGSLFPSVFDALNTTSTGVFQTTGAFYNNAQVALVLDATQITMMYQNTSDNGVAHAAAGFLASKPSFTFIQFDEVAQAGEAHGYNSSEYLSAAATADQNFAIILDALQFYLGGQYLLVVQSDHGGSHKTEGQTNNASIMVPWIAVGEGVRYAFDILEYVSVMDSAALALWSLGVPQPAAWIAKPPLSIFYESS